MKKEVCVHGVYVCARQKISRLRKVSVLWKHHKFYNIYNLISFSYNLVFKILLLIISLLFKLA